MQAVVIANEFLALESQMNVLVDIRNRLMSTGFDTRIAMEADALEGSSELTRLAFSSVNRSRKHQIALEGIGARIWDAIKSFFRKIGELIVRFINWITGGKKVVISEETVHEAEKSSNEFSQSSDEFMHEMSQVTRELQANQHVTDLVKQACEDLANKLHGPSKVLILGGGAHNPYTDSVKALMRDIRGKPADLVSQRLQKIDKWFEPAWQQAKEQDQEFKRRAGLDQGIAEHAQKVSSHSNEVDFYHNVGGSGITNDIEDTTKRIEAAKSARANDSAAKGTINSSGNAIQHLIKSLLEDADVSKLGDGLNRFMADMHAMGEVFEKFQWKVEGRIEQAKASNSASTYHREEVGQMFLKECQKFAREVQCLTQAVFIIFQHYKDAIDAVLALQSMLIGAYDASMSSGKVEGTKVSENLAHLLNNIKAKHADLRRLRATLG